MTAIIDALKALTEDYLDARGEEAASILASTGYQVDIENNIGLAGYNAARHVYLSAYISLEYGTTAAFVVGYEREFRKPADIPDKWDTFGDLWNNELGRRIATYITENNLPKELLPELVADAISNSALIITREDHRLPELDSIPDNFAERLWIFNNHQVDWTEPSEFWLAPDGLEPSPIDIGTPRSYGEIIGPCFSAGTKIKLANSEEKAIEEIQPGDIVAAFDEHLSLGRGELSEAVVARLIPGITEKWVVLEDGTRVTPSHRYLTEFGDWATISDLISSDIRAVSAGGTLVQLRGNLISATDAGSDAQWIVPLHQSIGNVVAQPEPVFGWRTYNFEVEGLHTYVAGGLRVHNDCLNPGESVVPNSFAWFDDATGYSIDVVDPISGLVTTINHSLITSPIDGTIVDYGTSNPLINRETHLPFGDSFLQQDFSFDDITGIFAEGNWSFRGNDISYQFPDLPEGIRVVTTNQPMILSNGDVPSLVDYNPFQSFGYGVGNDGVSPLSLDDFNWINFVDEGDNVIVNAGYRQPDPIPADPDTGTPEQPSSAELFFRMSNSSSSGGGFSDVHVVGGAEAFKGVGNEDGSYYGMSLTGSISGSDSTDTTGGGEGSDTLSDGPSLVSGRWKTTVQTGDPDQPTQPVWPTISGANLGKILGASFSTLIPTDNLFAQVGVSAALQAGLTSLGATFDTVTGYTGPQDGLDLSIFDASGNLNGNLIPNLGQTFAANAVTGGIGLASGMLAAGLADAVGLDGNDFGAALFKTAASTTINYGLKQVASSALQAAHLKDFANLVASPSKTVIAGLPPDVGGLVNSLGVSIGSMVGTRLANQIVKVENIGGAIGSSIGSAVGTTLGIAAIGTQVAAQFVNAVGTLIAGVVLPGIGAFIGTALGTLLGNWIGNLFQDEGWGHGTIAIEAGDWRFLQTAYNGNDADFTRPVKDRMDRARAILKQLVLASGGTSARRIAIDFHVEYNGSDRISYTEIRGGGETTRRYSNNPQLLVDVAVTQAARKLDIVGGDPFVSYQLDRNHASTVEELALEVAWAGYWSNIAELLTDSVSGSEQQPVFNLRVFDGAVGDSTDAVWRTAREFGRTLNDPDSPVCVRNKEILGINVVRALMSSEAVYIEQLQSQLIAASVFQKALDFVMGETGGTLAAIMLPDLNVGGLMRKTDANGNYIETAEEHIQRITSWGIRLVREALQANVGLLGDKNAAVTDAVLQATTNDQTEFMRSMGLASYFGTLMKSVMAGVGGEYTYDMPNFYSLVSSAFPSEQDDTEVISQTAIDVVKGIVDTGLTGSGGDQFVMDWVADNASTDIARFDLEFRAVVSFSQTLSSMRDSLAEAGITFVGFDHPDFSTLQIVIDGASEVPAEEQEISQITTFVEQNVINALSSGDFVVNDAVSSAVRNTTATTLAEFAEQITIAQTFEGIVAALGRLGIDADSIVTPDFNDIVVGVAVPGEEATDADREAYANAIKSAAAGLISPADADAGFTGQTDAVAALVGHRDQLVEIALSTQARVAGVLQYLTHKDQILFDEATSELSRTSVVNGSVVSLGLIDLSTVDLSPYFDAADEGSADLALAEIADALAFQALRVAEISGGDPYELSALYSPTVTNYGELVSAVVASSDLSLYADNRSIVDALITLDTDSTLSAGWLFSTEVAGAIHGIRVPDASEFDLGVASRLTTLKNAGALADLTVEVRNNGLAIVRDSDGVVRVDDSLNPIILAEITNEAELVAIASDAANPVTGTGANDLWIASNGGEAFTDAATLADGELSHDVLLGGAGDDVINAGFGNDYASGGLGNDQIDGGDGDDVLDGGAGDDLLIGGTGNDAYLFKQGFGNDTIRNQDASVDATDIIAFGSGFTSEQIWFERLDNDLTVTDLGSDGTISIEGWYADPAAQVDVFQLADGSTLAAGDIEQLISAMASFNPADFGASAGSAQQPLPDEVRLAMNSTWQSAS